MPANKIKIATFNLNNLALPNIDYYPNERYSEELYEEKCRWIAGQLDALDADLVVFQEVFQKEALEHALSLCSPAVSAKLNDVRVPAYDGMSPRVCLATHYAIASCEWIEGIPKKVLENFNLGAAPIELDGKPIDRFSRPILRTQVRVPDLGDGVDAIVLGTHLKSKSADRLAGEAGGILNDPIGQARSLIRRAVEAVGLRCLVLNDLAPQEGSPPPLRPPLVLCGDCNDDTIAVTTQILCGARYGGYDKLLRSALELHSSRSLYSAYYTYIHDGHYESLDQIFLSDHFAPGNSKRIGDVEYVRFLTDHLVDETLYRGSIPRYQSDHGQVVVTIKPRDAGTPPPS